MKRLLFILLLIPFFATAQKGEICSKVIETTYDKVEQKTTKTFKKPIITNATSSVFIINFIKANNGDIYLTIVGNSSSGCTSPGSKTTLLLEDQTKIEIGNSNEISCGTFKVIGGFSLTVDNMDQLELLKSKKIELVRVYTDKGYIDATLKPVHRQTIMDNLNCLLN